MQDGRRIVFHSNPGPPGQTVSLEDMAGEEATTGLMLNQQDMANLIGATREVVNRALKTMEDKGAITLYRHRL